MTHPDDTPVDADDEDAGLDPPDQIGAEARRGGSDRAGDGRPARG